MGVIHGVRSFEGVRKRATAVAIGGHPLRVASLEDIVKSKKAADRPKGRAVLPILEAVIDAKQRRSESERAHRR